LSTLWNNCLNNWFYCVLTGYCSFEAVSIIIDFLNFRDKSECRCRIFVSRRRYCFFECKFKIFITLI